jgi:copper transport protein
MVSATGTPVLAAAGSGDLLSGIAGTMLAQLDDPLAAGACAAWAHGRAAEVAGAHRVTRGVALDDVAAHLGDAWQSDAARSPRYPVLAELPAVAELLALAGALLAAGACLVVPGAAGHAAQTSPRGLSLLFDWAHLVAGSIWVGGLVGLLVLWRSTAELLRVAALSFVVPRFSRVAFASVVLLIGSGIGSSVQHLPTLASLWQTSYGKALLVKIALLLAAMLLAAVNLSRTKPRLEAAATHPTLAGGAAVLLRRLVTGEVVFVFGALFAAGVLSSLAPPSKALAQLGHVNARVGPGPVTKVVERNGYRLDFRIDPNRAALPNSFAVRITRGGKPVTGAGVVARFAMLDMTMAELAYRLPEQSPGTFSRSAPALVMVGHWGLTFEVTPPHGQPFDVLLVDHATG